MFFILAAVGFGPGGVVAGSIAAAIQAQIGAVAAGSVFAALQALGVSTKYKFEANFVI